MERLAGWWGRRTIWTRIGLGLIAFGVALPLVWVAIFGASGEAEAKTECQVAIRQQLVSPGSGDFDYSSIRVVKGDSTHWTVLGFLTAKNALGVEIRRSFHCDMVKDHGWKVDDATIVEP